MEFQVSKLPYSQNPDELTTVLGIIEGKSTGDVASLSSDSYEVENWQTRLALAMIMSAIGDVRGFRKILR